MHTWAVLPRHQEQTAQGHRFNASEIFALCAPDKGELSKGCCRNLETSPRLLLTAAVLRWRLSAAGSGAGEASAPARLPPQASPCTRALERTPLRALGRQGRGLRPRSSAGRQDAKLPVCHGAQGGLAARPTAASSSGAGGRVGCSEEQGGCSERGAGWLPAARAPLSPQLKR